ncbi:unnamed protein product [Euphydryas editha]|uniref:DRBM domain-containing protein n=1 Tax=Euphydryas editha TaxID=104508 RepID=A0AAU9U2N5_EUPED|nr:unnamed protein product [Euphydryas editha]
MKTAVTVLQELMIKHGQLPEYECISQSGPQHQATFEYRCTTQGITVTGQARSKKEAKQEAARRMLMRLHARGVQVPPPFAAPPSPPPPSPPLPSDDPALEAGPSRGPGAGSAAPVLDTRSYVALLKELCEEYRLGEPEYELVGDTGPPHERRFTVCARLRLHERQATSTTKKAARQLAAESLYKYLRENLARLTKDFVEEEALARAHEKRSLEKRAAEGGAGGAGGAGSEGTAEALRRYAERCEPAPWRQDLGQRLADFHLGLLTHIGSGDAPLGTQLSGVDPLACLRKPWRQGFESLDAARDAPPSPPADEEHRALGAQALAASERAPPDRALDDACAALGLRAERVALAGAAVVRLAPTAPPLAFAAGEPSAAAAAALRYLRRALRLRSGSVPPYVSALPRMPAAL